MIGRQILLMDTGAPTEQEMRRLNAEARRTRDVASPLRPSILVWMLSWAAILRGRFEFKHRQPLRIWRELAAVSLFAMNLSWAVPWFRSLSRATQSSSIFSTFLVFSLLGMAAYLSMRLLSEMKITPATRNRALLGLLLLSIFVGLKSLLYAKELLPLTDLVLRPLVAFGNFSALIPNEIIVILAVLLVWRRGAVLSLDYIGPERVISEFKAGFWIFLLFTGLNTLVTRESVPFAYLGVFLFSGLLAMGAARMSAVSEVRGGSKNVFDRRRFLAVIFGVASAAGLAIWIGYQFSRDDAALAGLFVLLFVLGAFAVSIPLLLGLLYLLFEIVRHFQDEIAVSLDRMMQLIDTLLGVFSNIMNWIREAGVYLADQLDFLAPIFRWLFTLAPAMRLLVLAGSVMLVGALVYMAFWIRSRQLREGTDSEAESALSIGSLVDQFRRRLFAVFQDRRQLLEGLLDLNERRKLRLAARIRRLYSQLLELATQMGLERDAAQTPREFQQALSRLFAGHEADVALLTEAYLKVRYGEIPEGRPDVLAAERAFRRIRATAARHPGLLLKKG